MPEDQQRNGRRKNQGQTSYRKVPALEWIASTLGLILVIGSIAAILYYTSEQDAPPELRTEAGGITPVASGYLVEVTVHNDGGSTAAAVNVEGTLTLGGKTLETASTTFDYVPAHSRADGGMFFTHDPRAYQTHLEANAYMEP